MKVGTRTPIIIYDPGHGGVDPGAVGPAGQHEDDLALAIAKRCCIATSQWANPVLTRDKDIKVELKDRTAIANHWAAEVGKKDCLFVSIHLNGADKPEANGIETLYHEDSADGKLLAECVQKELVRQTFKVDKGVKDRAAKADVRGLWVLGHTAMTAILVEVGFITNPKEVARLQTEEFQTIVARAIDEGIRAFWKAKGRHIPA